MKKILFAFALTFLLFSCSSPSSPGEVAKVFMESVQAQNFEKAQKYCTPETALLMNLAMNMGKANSQPDFVFVLKEEIINGDKAKVKFTNELGKEESIDLKKVNGKWLVHATK